MSRLGQTWAIDLGISLVLFTVAVLITYQLLENTIDDTGYEDVRAQAIAAADLLAGTGYPATWTNGTVIRAGLASDGVLSLRKAGELARLTDNGLRQALRATDRTVIITENASGGIEPVFGACALGDTSITETPQNRTLPALAIARAPHPVSDGVNASVLENDTAYAVIDDYDVILIEGNLADGSERTPAQIAREFDAIARRGVTIVVVGDPGVPILGIIVNRTNATTITVTDPELASRLPAAVINLSGETIPTINVPQGADNRSLAVTEDGATAFATWITGDARVHYYATSDGAFADGSSWLGALRNITQDRISVPRPACDELVLPDAIQVARHDRKIAHHDKVLTLRVIAWREQ